MGDVFNEPWKWYDFISHSDGMIYGLPADANKILKFDPAAKTTTLVGDDLGLEAQFYGGLIGPDNMIYGIPGKNTNKTGILRFDPSTEETTLIQQGNALFASRTALAHAGLFFIWETKPGMSACWAGPAAVNEEPIHGTTVDGGLHDA